MRVPDESIKVERPRYLAAIWFWADRDPNAGDESAWFNDEAEAEAWVRARLAELIAAGERPESDDPQDGWEGSVSEVEWRRIDDTGDPTLDWDWDEARQILHLYETQDGSVREQ